MESVSTPRASGFMFREEEICQPGSRMYTNRGTPTITTRSGGFRRARARERRFGRQNLIGTTSPRRQAPNRMRRFWFTNPSTETLFGTQASKICGSTGSCSLPTVSPNWLLAASYTQYASQALALASGPTRFRVYGRPLLSRPDGAWTRLSLISVPAQEKFASLFRQERNYGTGFVAFSRSAKLHDLGLEGRWLVAKLSCASAWRSL